MKVLSSYFLEMLLSEYSSESCTGGTAVQSTNIACFAWCAGGAAPGSGASSEAEDAWGGPSFGAESLVSSREGSTADPEMAEGAGQAGPSSDPSPGSAGPSGAEPVRRPRTATRRQPRTGAPRGLDAITGVPGPSNPRRDREPPRARDLTFLAAAAGADPAPANGERHIPSKSLTHVSDEHEECTGVEHM